MSNIGERLTFCDIFRQKGYSIEIPIIQRDYAQGRESAGQVRKNFLSSIYDCLQHDRPIDLDFVYGSIFDHKFVPLDGQQRLTTLFLLHWYLASKEGHSESFRKIVTNGTVSRFSYETRITSRDFCNALTTKEVSIPPSPNDRLSDIIRNASWFYMSWEKDPTIKSMLIMLDAIHERFLSTTDYFEKLSAPGSQLISFQFIELEDFGLSDGLYIKMNARGRELTPFEVFKAKSEQILEEYYRDRDRKRITEFSQKIDTVWADLFWKYRDQDTNSYDARLMNFLRVLATNEYVLKPVHASRNVEELITSPSLTFYDYEKLDCLDANLIARLTETLDALVDPGTERIKTHLPDGLLVDESSLFQEAIQYRLSYPKRIQLHALYRFLNLFPNDPGLYDWIRIVRNLTENSRIDEIELYATALQSVDELLKRAREIVTYMAQLSGPLRGFAYVQVQEERPKAILVQKSPEWRQAIIDIENHGYFKGQIDFILSFSGLSQYLKQHGNLDWSAQDDQHFLRTFREYSTKAASVFGDSGLNPFPDFLFERALLCKGDYLLSKGRNYSFAIDSDRDIGWKRLLREDDSKRTYLKDLLDGIDASNIQAGLQQIVDTSNVIDWRRHFIAYPEMIGACGYNRFIRQESANDILLLQRTQTNGMHREYYSYALCVRLRNMGNEVFYHEDNSVDNPKYISNINGHSIQISYNYKGQYLVDDGAITFDFASDDEVIGYLLATDMI